MLSVVMFIYFLRKKSNMWGISVVSFHINCLDHPLLFLVHLISNVLLYVSILNTAPDITAPTRSPCHELNAMNSRQPKFLARLWKHNLHTKAASKFFGKHTRNNLEKGKKRRMKHNAKIMMQARIFALAHVRFFIRWKTAEIAWMITTERRTKNFVGNKKQ